MAMNVFSTVKVVLVSGEVAPGFEKVKEVFRQNFIHRNEVGASFCVYKDGKKVVDLWGGYRDAAKTKSWEADTVCMVFSTTKGISSLAFSLLHSKGLIDFDEKVVKYWPEFAQNGKENITIRQLLAHQAGLCATDRLLTLKVIKDEALLSDILAAQKTLWKPGTRQGYHAWTIAMYQNEILKRVDPKGRNLSQFFKEEVAEPLGLNINIGLPSDFNPRRIADLVPFSYTGLITDPDLRPDIQLVQDALLRPGWYFLRTLLVIPFSLPLTNFNKPEIRSLPIGSACGFTSARDLAALYSEFANQTPNLKLRPETIKELENDPVYPAISTKDVALHVRIPFSLGLAKPGDYLSFGSNHKAYGSFGAGGSAAFADPDLNLSMAYVMNRMGTKVANDPRELALRTAVFECIEDMKE